MSASVFAIAGVVIVGLLLNPYFYLLLLIGILAAFVLSKRAHNAWARTHAQIAGGAINASYFRQKSSFYDPVYPARRCRYCGMMISQGRVFCPHCHKESALETEVIKSEAAW